MVKRIARGCVRDIIVIYNSMVIRWLIRKINAPIERAELIGWKNLRFCGETCEADWSAAHAE